MNILNLKKSDRLTIAIILIVLNFAIGIVSKIPLLELIANPSSFNEMPWFYISAGLAYIFSWVLAFAGVYLIGKEAWEAAQKRMKKNVQKTYDKHIGKHVKRGMKSMKNIGNSFDRR